MAIGHVRYSTTGSSAWENAQPVWRSDRRQVALAHNGNLINAVELHAELQRAGRAVPRHLGLGDHRRAPLHPRGGSDRGRGGRRDAAARGRLLDRGDDEGRGRGVPRPGRPAAAGARDARRRLLRRVRELRVRHHRRRAAARGGSRARWSRWARAGSRRARWWIRQRRAFCVFEHIYFARPDSILEGNRTQVSRRKMGEILWREAPVEADVVIAVPDSGNPAASGYSKASGIPRDDGLIKNRYVQRTFIQPGQDLRKHGLRMKFNPLREVVAGKRLVVVDDSIVRGNTTRQIVQMLRDAGRGRDPHAHLGAADPPSLPLRRRHVDDAGDGRPRAHGGGDRGGARLRLAPLPLARRRVRGDPLHARDPLRRLLLGRLPTRADRRPRTASTRSRSCRS